MVFTRALKARINQMEETIKAAHGNDPILGMAAEAVTLTYLDAMRCSMLVLKGQANNSDAERVQGLADRSLRRFVLPTALRAKESPPNRPRSGLAL